VRGVKHFVELTQQLLLIASESYAFCRETKLKYMFSS
jgi:hypothetical protein